MTSEELHFSIMKNDDLVTVREEVHMMSDEDSGLSFQNLANAFLKEELTNMSIDC